MNQTPTQTPRTEGWLSPLKYSVFRALWSVWLVANICMWMNDVAAAWTMTSLTTSATLIALVQKTVQEQTTIELVREIHIIGDE